MHYVVVIILFIFSIPLKAQYNLVPNPSFEMNDTCPTQSDQIWLIPPWTNVLGGIDYLHECGINNYGVPVSIYGGGYANSGQAYVSFGIWSKLYQNAREFVGVELSEALDSNMQYKVEFYFSMQDSAWYATRNIGAYFSQTQPPWSEPFLLSRVPQVKYDGLEFLTEKEGWTKIEGSFIATGGEKFITIGNFDNDANTDTLFVPGGGAYNPDLPHYWEGTGCFIDDVSVILDTAYHVGIENIDTNKFSIYPNPVTTEITVNGYSPAYLKLCNEVGQTVAESKSNKLYVGNLSQGLYVLQLFDAKGQQVKTEKVIVAK